MWPFRNSTQPKPKKHRWDNRVTTTTRTGFMSSSTEREEWRQCDKCGARETTGGWRRDNTTNVTIQLERTMFEGGCV